MQGVLLRAARELLGEDASTRRRGTDGRRRPRARAGRAPEGRKKAMPELEIAHGLNDRLPFDVNVLKVEPARARPFTRATTPCRGPTSIASPAAARRSTSGSSGGSGTGWTSPPCGAPRSSSRGGTTSRRSARTRRARHPRLVVVEKSEIADLGHEIHSASRRRTSSGRWCGASRERSSEVGRGNLDAAGRRAAPSTKSGRAGEVDRAAVGALPRRA